MNKRINYASGAPWESIVGYSRAVRVGNVVEITGTVASRDGNVVGPDSMYEQARYALEKIGGVLSEAGGTFSDVVRTRMFVTDISRWEEVARAHSEVFGTIRPCTTLVEVSALIAPEYLIEIEATAYLSHSD
ncbi:RidA family protein [Telluribacter sp.]|jgi:enamine deaminase RidA (YjgF/YER057c/UK114 family)|uniref:RidA family protein n=1 Tax=Telluribacter sp. TaxID=1978767 RepID=UPI002E0F8C6A|nr:RidA family protein [Telluribacter sp.]